MVTWYPLDRGLIYVTLLLLIGIQVARAVADRVLASDLPVLESIAIRRERLMLRFSCGFLLLVLLRGVLQVLTFLDPGQAPTSEIVQSALLEGTWGVAYIVQVAAAVALVVVTLVALRRRRVFPMLTIILLAAIVWGQTGMGHPAGNHWTHGSGRALDGAHLFGAGIWLGTLGALWLTTFPALRGDARLPQLAQTVQLFSLPARIGALTVVSSGLIAAWTYTGPIATIPDSAWGRLLLYKLAALCGVVALGWWNWRVVTPALRGATTNATARLRRAVAFELSLGLVMLAITAFLVATKLPSE